MEDYLIIVHLEGLNISNIYAKGQTGQQLLLGAYSALSKRVNSGGVEMFAQHEMLDLVLLTEKQSIITRNIVTGHIERFVADAVLMCTGGYEMHSFCLQMQWAVM